MEDCLHLPWKNILHQERRGQVKYIVMEHSNGILSHKSGPANKQHTNHSLVFLPYVRLINCRFHFFFHLLLPPLAPNSFPCFTIIIILGKCIIESKVQWYMSSVFASLITSMWQPKSSYRYRNYRGWWHLYGKMRGEISLSGFCWRLLNFSLLQARFTIVYVILCKEMNGESSGTWRQ